MNKLDIELAKDYGFFERFKGETLAHFAFELEQIGWPTSRALNHGLNFLNPDTAYAIGDHGNVVGFVDFQNLPDVIIFQYLIIFPELQRRGYGARAMQQVIDTYGKGKKIQSFYYNHNEVSKAMHAKLGFIPIGTVVQI